MEIVYSPREFPNARAPSPWDGFQARPPTAPAPAGPKGPSHHAWGGGPGLQDTPKFPWQQPQPGLHIIPPGTRHNQVQQYVAAHNQLRAQEQATTAQAATDAVTRYTAGPYQKEAAIRSAQRAIVPWAPYGAGVGERMGAVLAGQGPAAEHIHAPPWPGPRTQAWEAGQEQAGHAGQPGQPGQAGQAGQPGQMGQAGQMGPMEQGQGGPAWAPQGIPQPYGALYGPSPAAAEAYGRAAARVARAGTNQVDSPTAWSAVPHAVGRELWPSDIVQAPRFCTGCRGDHDPSKERNPTWEPYSPETRLRNLRMLVTRFQSAMKKAKLDSDRPALCARFEPGSQVRPLRWLWQQVDEDESLQDVTPGMMSQEEFTEQLVLLFDGLREGHEPYRHLATLAATAFLDTGSPFIVKAVPRLVQPLRLGMQTYEPHLVGHILLMLQRLLKSHPGVGPELRPHLVHLLPYLALFRPRKFKLHLPPPFCVPSTASFSGKGQLPGSADKSCGVCGAPTSRLQYDKAATLEKAQVQAAEAAENAHNMKPQPKERSDLVKGRRSKKHVMSELIDSTLELLVQLGGPGTLKTVQRQIPRFCYFDPKD